MSDGHSTGCVVGTGNDLGLDSCLGQGGLEKTVEVCRNDHLDEATCDQAGYGVVGFCGKFQPFSPLLLCGLEVRLQKIATVDSRRSQPGKQGGVVRITVSMISIPGDWVDSCILPSQDGKAPDEIECHMPAGLERRSWR